MGVLRRRGVPCYRRQRWRFAGRRTISSGELSLAGVWNRLPAEQLHNSESETGNRPSVIT